MDTLNNLVDDLKSNISNSDTKLDKYSIMIDRVYRYGKPWINLKKLEFKENKSGIIKLNEYEIKFIENKDIPFEALILTKDDINLRNDIYKDLFINNNFNEDSLMRFIDNIFLFYDMTKFDETSKIIDDILSLKEMNPHSKDILDNLKTKMVSFNNVRKNFNHNKFVNNIYKNIPMVGMVFKEHGQPFLFKQH